jgi:hypothetical protein
MSRVMGILILFFVVPGWSTWQCDLGRELGSVKPTELMDRSSKPFQLAYNHRYTQHADAMRSFEAANPGAKPNAYLETPEGKKTAERLKDTKLGFEFETAIQYLLGEPIAERPSNAETVSFTHTLKRGKKVFYLDDGHVVAIRIQTGKDTFLLKVLDPECRLREIVSLDGLKTGDGGNAYRYKINQAYCDKYRNQVPPEMDQDKMDEMKIYIPEDELERNSLKSQIDRDCRQWPVTTGASPKSSGASSTK